MLIGVRGVGVILGPHFVDYFQELFDLLAILGPGRCLIDFPEQKKKTKIREYLGGGLVAAAGGRGRRPRPKAAAHGPHGPMGPWAHGPPGPHGPLWAPMGTPWNPSLLSAYAGL